MARRTEDVKRDIEQTRDELGNTLEAIGDRVAPKKVVGRVKTNVSEKVDDVKYRVNPMRIVRDGIRSARGAIVGNGGADDASDDGFELPSARARSGNGRGPAKQLASRAGDTASSAASRAGNAAGSLATRAGDAAGSVSDQARSAPRSLRQRTQENPFVAGLVVFGGGFLLASRIPPTERERQLSGQAKERLEPVKQQALEAGRGVAEELKGVAQESIGEVRQRATGAATQVKDEAMLLAEKVKEDARGSAEQVKEEASAATDDVQGEARAATRRVKSKAEDAAAVTTGQARARRKPAASKANGGTTTRRTRAAVR